MNLRERLLMCVVGLGAALLPGCTSTATGIDPREHIPDLPRIGGGPASPYYQQADPVAMPPARVQLTNREKPAPAESPPRKEETPPPLPPLPPAAPATSGLKPMPVQESKKSVAADEPLVVALRAYLQKRPGDALDALAHYEKPNQDMLLVALPFAARLTEGNIDGVSPHEAAELADLLQGVEERLRRRAALHVEKMLFCRRIDDFGVYVPREPVNGIHTFEGGAGDQPGEPVQVYVELRNVSSKQHGDAYETRLAGSIELFDGLQRQSAYRKDFAPELYRGRSTRHDFFVNCSFAVPRKLPPGRYTLRVEVRDITELPPDPSGHRQVPPGHRVARQEIDLQVIEPRSDRGASAAH
jgi:hypothetical protein